MAKTGTAALPQRRSDARGRAASARIERDGYHHGDLRAALIAAAETELAEKGIDGFTLRGCARRAGVSHAAPAHHFKDVRALLTELATIGFRRLSASMDDHAAGVDPGSVDYVVAIGRGYVAFAERHPQSFGLIFRTANLDREEPEFVAASREAFSHPVRAVGALYGSDDPMSDPKLAEIVIGIWSQVHGFAALLLAGQFDKHVAGGRRAIIDKLVPPMLFRYFAADEAPPESKSRRASRRHSHSR
jgi:AcrR family transcriptional regulator